MPLTELLSLKKNIEKSTDGISSIRDTTTKLTAEVDTTEEVLYPTLGGVIVLLFLFLIKHLRECRSHTPVPVTPPRSVATPPRSAEVPSNTDAIELPSATEPTRAVPRFERVIVVDGQPPVSGPLVPLAIGDTPRTDRGRPPTPPPIITSTRHLRGFVYNASTLP